jgi:hypothetical protein
VTTRTTDGAGIPPPRASVRQLAAGLLAVRWLWLLLPAVMLYHVPSEKWVQRVTTVGSYHLQTSELAYAYFAVWCLLAATSRGLRTAWRSGFAWPWLGYLAAFAVSSAFAINRQLALVQDVMVLAGALLALTVWLTVTSADQLRKVLAVIVIGGVMITIVIAVLVAYAQSTTPHPCPDSGVCLGGTLDLRAVQIGGQLFARGEIPGVDYNRTGTELVLATFAALYLARTSSGRRRWVWILTALIVFSGMLLTLSKGALLSFGFGLAVLLLAGWYRAREVAIAAVAIVFGLAVTQHLVPIALRSLSILSFIPPVNRFLVSGGTLDTSDRAALVETSLGFFHERPITGLGPLYLQTVETVQGASVSEHNEYVRALVETGVIGAAALVVMVATPVAFVIAALRMGRPRDNQDLQAGHLLLAGLVALAVNFLVAPIEYSYWTWVGLTGAWLTRCAPDLRLLSLLTRKRAASSPLAGAPLPTP